ncbi:MAG TPA: flagellar basal-body rod protein FlgG [Alphaproteobacteria bacterium]|nr:flagellar basal-body rod protein FlgG [Alphaproteobacteria bacterium]
MYRALQIAATGMAAQQLNVEVISNNVANLNSTGYKRRIAEFQDLLYQNLNRDVGVQSTTGGNLPPVGNQVGLGVKNSGIFINTNQGTLVKTDGKFDLAIQGKGYFQVTNADGTVYYTRSGRFSPDGNGLIVDPNGFQIDPGLTLPQDYQDVTINQQGEVFVTISNTVAPQLVGRITAVNFLNESGLRPEGNNLFTETLASGSPTQGNPGAIGYGTVQQGFIETSNVDAVNEITSLIVAQRAYELNSRVISTSDDMLNAINQIR